MNRVKSYRALYYLLHKTGLIRIKEDLVLCYSAGRTSSVRGLKEGELSSLLGYLRGQVSDSDFTCDRLRKALIAQSYSIGEGLDFVQRWSEQMGIFGVKKGFNEYDARELKGLLEKFKKVVRHRMEGVNKELEKK